MTLNASDTRSFAGLASPLPGHNVRLFKGIVLFIVAVGFVLLIVWLCVRSLLSLTTQPDEKKWAMSILTAAAGGLIGYLVKK